jgi:TatA/E family protein of Tat protein translocase
MDFFGIGPMEILLILIIGLLIFGPGKMPQIARDLGKALRSFKKATTDLSAEVSRELEEEKKEINSDTKQIKQEIDEISNPAKPEAGKTPADGNPL